MNEPQNKPISAATLNFSAGFWRLADPKISITSVAAMLIGAPMAWRDGEFSLLWLVVTAAAFFAMEVAKNAWGDVYDFDSGTDLAVTSADRTDFSGGKRVLVDGLLTRRQTWGIAVVTGGIGITLGAAIVFLQAPAVFWLGLIGLVAGWSYHGPPLQLVYRGLGELDVVLCYGPLLCLATYMIQTNHFSPEVLLLSLPLGILISAFLWVNEFPDHDADAAHGKRNLVVMLGKQKASRMLPLIYGGALVVHGLLGWMTTLGPMMYASLVWLLPAVVASLWVWQDPQHFYRHRPVQPLALVSFVLYALATACVVLLSSA